MSSRPSRFRRRLGVAAVVVCASAPALALTPAVSGAARREVLYQQFSSCPKFLAYVRNLALPTVGPYGFGSANAGIPTTSGGTRKKSTAAAPQATIAPAAARAATADTAAASAAAPSPTPSPAAAVSADATAAQANSSTTNTQEVGVDEGDLIENDGRYLYTGVGGSVRIVDTTNGTLVATIPGAPGSELQLLLDGPRLAVIRQLFSQWPETIVERWDVSTPSTPRFLSRVHLEGTLVASRTVDHRARVVLQTPFGARIAMLAPGGSTSADFAAAQRANRAIVSRAKADDWLPRSYNSDQGGNPSALRQAVNCVEIGKPADTSGLALTWVATIDLDVPDARLTASGSGGVVGSGNLVYASERTLYVATSAQNSPPIIRVATPQPGFGVVAPRPVASRTLLHSFDLSGRDGATYLASGSVDGRLLNQFSLSEFGGVLRVAVTTDGAGFGSPQQSGVRVLARNGRSLDQIGSLNGLGLSERIYAVRFLGDLGYIVTFRQVDPLYVIDLRDPRAPRRAGELKIPGYSSYLHPIGVGQLLGIGQDATDQGQRLGTSLQVFDVSNPDAPRQVMKLRVGGQSEAEYDHRAFLWWAPTRNAVIPQSTVEGNVVRAGALVTKVGVDAITVQGRITHEGRDVGPGPSPLAVPAPAATTPAPVAVPAVAGSPVAVPPVLPPPPTTIVPIGPPQVPEIIRRSSIVNGRLVTVSANAVKVSDLGTVTPIFYSTFFDR